MRSLCRSDSKDGGNKTTDTIVAEVVFDNASAVGVGIGVENGRAKDF